MRPLPGDCMQILPDRCKVLLAFSIISLLSCLASDQPPHVTARVVTVYKEEMVLNHFKILYWWQERGETPFLKTHTYAAKELIVEVVTPDSSDPNRVSITTERIPLQDLATITSELTEFGKSLQIVLRSGRRISASTNFPRVLTQGTKTGLAEHKVHVLGEHLKSAKKNEIKLDLNFIKTIEIISVDSGV